MGSRNYFYWKKAFWGLSFLLLPSLVFSQDFKVIGYLTHYYFDQADQVDFEKLTHLNIAFANPDMEGNLNLTNQELAPIVQKAHQEGVAVCISVAGGALLPEWWEAWKHLIQEQNRAAFIHKLIQYMHDNNLQGIDVDLEWSHVNDDYSGFVLELRDSIDKYELLLTAALPGTYRYPQISDEALAAYDWINMMAYDLTGPWNPNDVGPHSPFYFAENAIAYWLSQGVDSERLTLGVPFYGWDFTDLDDIHSVTYREMIELDPANAEKDQVGAIYYNGRPTIKAKTALAKEAVSGIMIWHLTQDAFDDFSLLKTIDEEVNDVVSTTQLNSEKTLLVYPNPFNNWLHVQPENQNPVKIILTDGQGRQVLKKEFNGKGVISLNVQNMPQGFYCLSLINEIQVITTKLVKH